MEQVTKNTRGNETGCEHGASVHAYICKRDQYGANEVVTVGWLVIRLGWTALESHLIAAGGTSDRGKRAGSAGQIIDLDQQTFHLTYAEP